MLQELELQRCSLTFLLADDFDERAFFAAAVELSAEARLILFRLRAAREKAPAQRHVYSAA